MHSNDFSDEVENSNAYFFGSWRIAGALDQQQGYQKHLFLQYFSRYS